MMSVSLQGADLWLNLHAMKPTYKRHMTIERYIFIQQVIVWLLTILASPQKSTCSDHKAVNRVNTTQAHLQATGIGVVACARHGCFFPQAVVDFQKGERFGFNFWKDSC
jgi:hypothetical protein